MMSRLLYYLIILPISILNYKILYFISDILFFIMYRVIRYRKKIITINLKKSFPKKNNNEIVDITKAFYRHLCDLIVEGIKSFSITKNELKNRLKFRNIELVNKYAKQNKNIIIVGGHYNNWEIFAQGFSLYSKHKCIGIYKKINNRFFDIKINNSRSKYGMNLISMKNTIRSFEDHNNTKAIIFGSDQNPANPNNAYWMKFLNQDTAVLFGTEKFSKKYNWPVIFVNINKLKRGYYEAEFSVITEKPNDQPYGKITEDFTKILEKNIINLPQFWLWSHKRWKHKK